MLDIGVQEIVVIMVIALLVFGPDKLPELGRRLGRAMREFRRASDEFRSTIETNLHLNEEESILPRSASPTVDSALAEAGGGGATAGVGSEGTSPSSAPAEAVATGADGASPDGQAMGGEPLEPYWTRRGGRLLHRRACAWRGRVPEAERVGFKAATDGWDLGLMPCPVCDPREAEVTS